MAMYNPSVPGSPEPGDSVSWVFVPLAAITTPDRARTGDGGYVWPCVPVEAPALHTGPGAGWTLKK